MQIKRPWLIALAAGFALLLSLLAIFKVADNPGEAYLEQSLQRALITFATARALNGVISVAQGTQIALEPAGVGVNFSPGEILDPINDLIERFSWVMLAASSSLGVQKLMLSIGAWWPVTVALIVALGVAVWGLWQGAWSRPVFRLIVGRVLVFTLLLRFAVPLVSLGGELIYSQFLAPTYTQASAELEATHQEIGSLNEASASQRDDGAGLLRRLGDLASEIGDWRAKLEQYRSVADSATRSALDLIVLFIFQTAVLPLLFLWCLLGWAGALFKRLAGT